MKRALGFILFVIVVVGGYIMANGTDGLQAGNDSGQQQQSAPSAPSNDDAALKDFKIN